MKQPFNSTAALLVFLCAGTIARAQIPAPPPMPEMQLRSSDELDQMLGPIALFPDPLLAQILPAATWSAEVVLADRYVNGGGDLTLIDEQSWDSSVKALARYPILLQWMDDNLAWTTALGQAFLYQPEDVMDSIQRLRAQAQALGNLQPTPQENVIADDGIIEILPANPEVIYVPVYQPDMVYCQRSYGNPLVSFGVGWMVGAWLDHDFDWRHHHLIVWRHDQPRPVDWWCRRPSERPRTEVDHAYLWQPRHPPGLTARGLDRGRDAHQINNTVTITGGQSWPAVRHEASTSPYSRDEPVAVRHSVEAPRSRPANGALIGVQSSRETRQFSTRGQESRQMTTSRPAPPPTHAEAPSHPAGAGKR